jgi:hypothetical protein
MDAADNACRALNSTLIPVDIAYGPCHIPVVVPQENRPMQSKLDLLQGTLDVMVLRTLSTLGPLHRYGIAPKNRAGQRR